MRLTSRGKKRILIILAVMASLIGSGVAILGVRDAIRNRAAEQARIQGLEAYRQGQYETALRELSTSLSRNPNDLEPLLAFADSRARVPDVNNRHLIAASQLYNIALKLDSNNLEALNQLLQLYKRIGYRTELFGVADRLLALDANHSDAAMVKAGQTFRERNYAATIEIARRMCEALPEDLAWRALHVRAMQAQGASEQSILELCNQWIQSSYGGNRFRLFKTQFLAAAGRLPEARREIALALETDVDSAPLLQSMISMLDQLEMRAEADALIARSKDRFKDVPWVYEASIRRHWQASRMDQALAELDAAERHFGDQSIPFLKWRALLLASSGTLEQVDDAISQLRNAAQTAPSADRDSALAWADAIEARAHRAESNWLQSIQTFERAIALQNKDAVLQFMLAEAYSQIGEHRSALNLLDRAIGNDPGWLAAHVARAQTLIALNQPQTAFSEMAGVVRRSANSSPSTFLLLCRAWLNGGAGDNMFVLDEKTKQRYDLLSLLSTMKRQSGWNASTARLLAEAYLRKNRTHDAMTLIQEAIDDLQVGGATLLALGEVSAMANLGYEQKLIEAARTRDGLTEPVVSAQATLLQRQGKAAEAAAVIREAQSQNPSLADSIELRWQLAMLLLEQGQNEGAQQTLELISNSTRADHLLDLIESEAAWRDPTVIRVAIDRLRELLGDRSTRVQLAEADFLNRFRHDDPQSVVRALEIVNAVLRRNPDLKSALTLAATLQMAGDNPSPDEAIRHLKHAVDLYPDDASLLPRLITMLQQRGDFESARAYLDRAANAVHSSAELCRAHSRLLEAQGEFERAASLLSQIAEDSLTEADRIRMAGLWVRAGQADRAKPLIDRLLAQPAPSADAVVAAAEFEAQIGHLDRALQLVDARMSDEVRALKQLCRGKLQLNAGLHDQAQEALDEALRLEPDNAAIWIELARLHVARAEYEAARDALMSALKLDLDHPVATSMLGEIGFSLCERDRQQTIATLSQQGRREESLIQTLRLCSALEHPQSADLAAAQKLTRDHPHFAPAWRLAVTLHAQAKQWEQAIALSTQAAAWLPADAAPAEQATRLLMQAGRTGEAMEMARWWRRLSLQNPRAADTVIAALALELGDPNAAADQLASHLSSAFADPDRYAESIEIWLVAAIQTQRAEEAVAHLNVLAQRPAWRIRILSLAARLDLERSERIFKVVEPLIASDAERMALAQALCALGRAFNSTESYDRADLVAQEISASSPQRFEALLVRAMVAAGLNELDAAETMYREALSLQPNHAVALSGLADVLVRHGGSDANRCAEALKLAERAAELRVDDPRMLDVLAQAHLCVGNSAQAEQRILSALRARPNDPAFRLTLARIKLAQGKDAEARTEYEAAVRSIGPLRSVDGDIQRRASQVKQLLGL